MGLWKYIANKIKPLLKDEIVSELCTNELCDQILKNKGIESKIENSVDVGVSRLKKEISSASSELKKERKGLVATVRSLSDDINGYSMQTAEAIRVSEEAMDIVTLAQSAADAAKAHAEIASARALVAENIAKEYQASLEKLHGLIGDQEKIYASVDEKINQGVQKVVSESTVRVNEELKKAMGELRIEYLDLKQELLERINEKFIDISGQSKELITKGLKECTNKVDGVVDEFNKSKTETIDGFKKSSSELIAELESFRQYTMKDINDVANDFKFISYNMPHISYILSLSSQQRRILTELYDKYYGNVIRFKEDLNVKCSSVNGKTELRPDEIELKYASRNLDNMLEYQQINRLGGVNNLREILKRVDNWYTRINAMYSKKNSRVSKKD